MVQLPWSDFFKKKTPNYNVFGPLTRCKSNVDQDEWPCVKKWMCLFSWYIRLNWTVLKNIKIKFDHSFVFFCCHLPFPNKIFHRKFFITICSLPYALAFFFYHNISFAWVSYHKIRWAMSMDNVSLEICFLGTLNSMVILTFFFLGLNRSGSGTNSTTNHKFCMGSRRLYGPWCKQPLNRLVILKRFKVDGS